MKNLIPTLEWVVSNNISSINHHKYITDKNNRDQWLNLRQIKLLVDNDVIWTIYSKGYKL